jgi:multicomponent Na+:H+ antiporter subunit D
MIGIPGISGFMSKIYLGLALISDKHPIFLSLILLSSFLNAIYYMPILISSFLKEDILVKNSLQKDPLPLTMLIPMIIITLAVLLIGLYPQLIMDVIEMALPFYF